MQKASAEVVGYSERGLLNAIVHDLQRSDSCTQHLSRLLQLSKPDLKIPRDLISVEFLIEQSFSEFGSADLVVFLDTADNRKGYTVFVEAKVACHQKKWSIKTNELVKFQKKIDFLNNDTDASKRICNSDLFTQLFFKQLMVETVQKGENSHERLRGFGKEKEGSRISLGNNPVVKKAVERLEKHLDGVFYIALIPASEIELDSYLRSDLKVLKKTLREPISYLTWESISAFCKENPSDFPLTLNGFEYNGTQIFLNGVTASLRPGSKKQQQETGE